MRNAFSSLTKYDFLDSPDNIFSHTTIGSDGFASWEYTFIDDGIKEGLEDMAISMMSLPAISFNLVIDDPQDVDDIKENSAPTAIELPFSFNENITPGFAIATLTTADADKDDTLQICCWRR